MSRKTGLAKKIAHTLMAMSIVYSSGINIVVNEVYAAEKIKEITTGGTFTESGTAGNDYDDAGGITDGEDLSYTGVIKTSDLSGNDIEISVYGGRGGLDNVDDPTVKQGAKGGDAIAKITVDESLSSVTTGDIAVSAYAGKNGSAYQGLSQVAGAAAAYGLAVKHDLMITAADISVTAVSEFDIPVSANKVDISGAKHSNALAVGLQVDDGTVIFSGGKMKVCVNRYYNRVWAINKVTEGATKFADGGDAEAYGIRVTGGEVTATLTDKFEIENSEGSIGGGANVVSGLTNAVDGGAGGNAVASLCC